jgi:hypothetical protein
MRRLVWASRNIEGHRLVTFLNAANFQAGKFHILPCIDGSPGWVTVVYVDKEYKGE